MAAATAIALFADADATTALLFLFLLVVLVAKATSEWRHLPPGPLGNHLPFFGYLPFLGGTRPAHETLTALSRRYGRIFRVQLGARTMVVISDHKLFRETFKREDMTDRPHTPLNDGIMDGYGISAAEGNFWKIQRNFTLASLRQMGMLRSYGDSGARFEENAARAIDVLLREVTRMAAAGPFDLERLLSFTVANVFCSIVISKAFDLFDPALMTELDDLQDSFRIIESISVANFLPIFCYAPRFRRVLTTVLGRRHATRNFFRKIIEEHRATMDPDKPPRDLIDAFIVQMDKDQTEGVRTTFTEIQLLSMMGDIFSAGTETTKTTIRWLLLAMAKKPHVQKKLQEELDAIVGRDRRPRLSDRQHLPYTEAVIQETLRVSSAVPLGNPHCPNRDITVDGYHIPKGCLVTGLLWKFHRDPQLWKNADDFDPDNFLRDDGSVYKPDHLMPFSSGRRICIGEDLARNEVFLVSASLLQKFTFLPPGDVPLPSFDDSRAGFLRAPVTHCLRVVVRH